MGRVTLKDLVEKYNAPRSIITNWYYRSINDNAEIRTALEANVVSEIEYWLGYLVYTVLKNYAGPRHFIVKRPDLNTVKLVFSWHGKTYELCKFSFATSRMNVYVRKNFRPLLCVLTRLEKGEVGKLNFPYVVKECCKQ